jgi:uncharacterized protein YuzE
VLKPIRFSRHAQEQLLFRGSSPKEVEEAIRTSSWEPAELGRLECRRSFSFPQEWHGLRVLSGWGTSMRITYDREVDALYFRFRDTTVTTKHLGEGVAADYDSDGRLAGIEILDASRRLGDPAVLRQVILEGVGPGRD